jgi:hypothetical protein
MAEGEACTREMRRVERGLEETDGWRGGEGRGGEGIKTLRDNIIDIELSRGREGEGLLFSVGLGGKKAYAHA